MKRAAFLAFMLLALSSFAIAAQPPASPGSYTEVSLQVSNPPGSDVFILRAHAYYIQEQVLDSNRQGLSGDAGQGDFQQFRRLDIPDGAYDFKFDGQPIVGSDGKLCKALSASAFQSSPVATLPFSKGDAFCNAAAALDPASGKPVAFRDWYRPATFSAEFLGSPSNARWPRAIGAVPFFPSKTAGFNLYMLWGTLFSDRNVIITCLPLIVVLGLLITSMMYMGKDPFSLYDITTPRLPAMKRVRMKSPNIPYHLAVKPRASAQLIRRHEGIILTQLIRLYRDGGASKEQMRDLKRQVRAQFASRRFSAVAIHKVDNVVYNQNLDALKKLADKAPSGSTADHKRMVKDAIDKSMQVREALFADLAAIGAARAGADLGTQRMQRGIERVTMALGNPLRAASIKNPDSKLGRFSIGRYNLLKLPYVERTGLIINNWLGSRANIIRLRRDLYKSALAEMGLKTHLLSRTSDFASKNAFFNKKLADLPDIVATMRQQTYLMGLGISDESLRLLAEVIYLKNKSDAKLGGRIDPDLVKYNEASVRLILQFKKEAWDKAIAEAGGDERKMNVWVARQYLIERLIEHIKKENLQIHDRTGTALNASDRNALLELIKANANEVAKLLSADMSAGGSIVNGHFPDLNSTLARSLNPEEVNTRMRDMVGAFYSFAGADNLSNKGAGRVPLVMLGRDLSDVLGRAVDERQRAGILLRSISYGERDEKRKYSFYVPGERFTEDLRLFHIRMGMEGELRRRRLFSFIFSGRPIYGPEDSNKPSDPSNKNNLLRAGSAGWFARLEGLVSAAAVRADMDYARRAEWSGRNYLTGHIASMQAGGGYFAMSERNKIDFIRKAFALEFGTWIQKPDQPSHARTFVGGSEDLFSRFRASLDRTFFTYENMKAVAPYYIGSELTASAMQRWRERGVLGSDISRGIWLITGDRVFIPLASHVERYHPLGLDGKATADAARPLMSGFVKNSLLDLDERTGLMTYRTSSLVTMMGSDYADRPINAALLYRTAGGGEHWYNLKEKWRSGSPTDHHTQALAHRVDSLAAELASPRYGQRSPKEEQDLRRQLREMEDLLGQRIMLVSRTSMALDRADQVSILKTTAQRSGVALDGSTERAYNNWLMTRAQNFSQMRERILRAGAHPTDMRLHDWYTSQAVARLVLFSYEKWYNENKEELVSKPVRDLLKAKEWEAHYASERNKLLGRRQVTSVELEALQKACGELKAKDPKNKKLADIEKSIQNLQENAFVGTLSDKEAKKEAKRISSQFGSIKFIDAFADNLSRQAARLESGALTKTQKAQLDSLDSQLKTYAMGKTEYLFGIGAGAGPRPTPSTADIFSGTAYSTSYLKSLSGEYSSQTDRADRRMYDAARMSVPFYNISEQTVMRDPRIVFANQHGLKAAIMSGYPTGQFVGERPNMWAGYNYLPGDILMSMAARPSYLAAMAYGMHMRTFFVKLSGYMSMYHLNPDRGGASYHEPGLSAAVQSLFKPHASFDWLTRLMAKPNVRSLDQYRDEFGTWRTQDYYSWMGNRMVFPLSWNRGGINKGGTVDDAYDADLARWARMGLDAEERMRQKGPLTYRHLNILEHKREAGYSLSDINDSLADMRRRLKTAHGDEKTVLKYQIREMEDTYFTQRKITRVPIIGKFFEQGYYARANIAGYDIAAYGGQHRGHEMVWAYQQNMGKAIIPGMYYLDMAKGNQVEVFPRVSRSLDTNAAPWAMRMKDRLTADYEGGLGRNWRADSLRDVYRKETPVLTKFMELETERQHYSFLNTPFTIPLSPLWIGAYHLARHLPGTGHWMRKQSWYAGAPRYTDEKITDEERREGIESQKRSDAALIRTAEKMDDSEVRAVAQKAVKESKYEREEGEDEGHVQEMLSENLRQDLVTKIWEKKGATTSFETYHCPRHPGISSNAGTACPLCRTDEEFAVQKFQFSYTAKGLKLWNSVLNHLKSSAPLFWQDHHFNLASCPTHGVQYERGTYCPLCSFQKKYVESKGEMERREDFKKALKDYKSEALAIAREMNRVGLRGESWQSLWKDRFKSDEERARIALQKGEELARLQSQREELDNAERFRGLHMAYDKRMRYKNSQIFMGQQNRRIKELEDMYKYNEGNA